MDINYQLPQIQRFPGLSEYTRQASLQALAPPPALSNSAMNAVNQQRLNLFKLYLTLQNKNLLLGQAVSSLTGQLSNQVSEGIFGTDTELGQAMGNLFSTGINTAGDQVVNNIFKGESLMNGMGQSVGSSLAGAGAGIAANYIGKGISSLGGNSKLSRGIGAGFSTGAGTLGGTMASNLVKGQSLLNGIKGMNTANLVGLGASIVGSGLQAAFGPSKEYGGTYGNITKGMDTAYDLIQGAAGFIPGVGTAVSGFMALNKGLSNVFGSTSGMTRQDAILGSAFMPAPVKWLNMAGAKTTDKFRNQSWLNQERTNTFMQNGFGDLGEKFDKARRESGKTYGTFSRHAYNKAQGNVNFANDAFNKILDMADDEETRRIRSEYMTSINNQRYAQDITGGFRPLYRGKEGMKIPEINHNFGQRLLSGAALIDNKQMILSALSGTKIRTTGGMGYIPPVDTEKINTNFKNRLYRTISPLAADYNVLRQASAFFNGKDYDYTRDSSDDTLRRAPTIDAIWAKYLQIPAKDRRYNTTLKKSKYKPSKGDNSLTYYKLPLVDWEKDALIDRTRDMSLNSNKVDSVFNGYGLGDHTIGRGYDNKGEYVSYFDTFDINPFNGKYHGIKIPFLNKLDDIGIGTPLKIYDKIYLDDYYKVPNPYRGGTYLPEVVVYPFSNNKSK